MLIDKETICLDIDTNQKLDAIDYLINVAYQNDKIIDKDQYKQAILAREEEFSTALGYLVAIPHGQSDTVKEPFVIFGRTKNTLIWDEHEVRLIFMIGVPMKNRDKTHMKILANISRKLLDDDFREKLLEAKDQNAVLQILNDINCREENE